MSAGMIYTGGGDRRHDDPVTLPTSIAPVPRQRARGAEPATPTFAAFISYSHQADGAFANRLQTGIERFATDDRQARTARVFRDDANLGANPNLWAGIVEALAASQWLVVLASPPAAASSWVDREITWWLEHGRRRDRILLVHTHGTLVWPHGARDFDRGASSALPEALVGVFRDSEPRVVDARSVGCPDTPRRAREDAFESALADVAATVRGVQKDQIRGEHLAVQRRAVRRARLAVTVVSVLGVAALIAGLVAGVQRNAAVTQATIASARAYAAEADAVAGRDPALAAHMALAAYNMDPSASSMSAVMHAYERARPIVRILEGASGLDAPPGRVFPGNAARSVSASADGRFVAVGAYEAGARVWERDTGRLVGTYPSKGGTMLGASAELSDDGRQLATSEGVISVPDGRPVDQPFNSSAGGDLPPPAARQAASFDDIAVATDAHRWVSLVDRSRVQIHDLSSGTVLRSARLSEGAGRAKEIGVSRDGSTVVVGDDEGRVTVLDRELRTQRVVARLPGHIQTVLVSTDGATATVREANDEVSALRLHNDDQPALPHSGPHIDAEWGVAEAAALVPSPDGRSLLVARPSGVELWSIANQRKITDVPLVGDAVGNQPIAAFDSTGERFAVLGEHSLHLFASAPLRETETRAAPTDAGAIYAAFADILGPDAVPSGTEGPPTDRPLRSPSGRYQVSDGRVTDVASGTSVALAGGLGRGTSSVFAFADNDAIVVENVIPDRDSAVSSNHLQLWHRETGALVGEWDDPPSPPRPMSQPPSVAIIGDTVAATVRPDGAVGQRVVAPSGWARRLCEVYGEPTDQVRRDHLAAFDGDSLCAGEDIASPGGEAPAAGHGPSTVVTPSPAPRAPDLSPPTSSTQPLFDQVRTDRTAVETLAGSWVPQLSSKRVGTVADGITYSATDILDNYRRLAGAYPEAKLLYSGDWPVFNGADYWVVVVALPSATPAAANAWCASQGFASNDCFAKQIKHSGSPAGTTVLR